MEEFISIPIFRAEYEQRLLNGLESPKDLSLRMTKENWLTDELVAEIAGLLPAANEKDGSGKRCPDAYLLKISKLFPQGRVFASYTQLVQASKMFLDAWAVQKVHGQKKITCSYGINHGKKPEEPHADPRKQRKQKSSLKMTDTPCPFFISYSLVNCTKYGRKPDPFYFVKVTSVQYNHNCPMSTVSHRVALRKSGQAQPNLEGMNTILSLLKEQPGLPNTVLRPLLQKYLPHYKAMDSSFMRNFRMRAHKFIILDPCQDLTLQDVNQVASRTNMAAEEIVDLDQPILRQNFTSLLRKCMQESSSTWVALRYLDETKQRVPGFDYRVHYDVEGCPDGIVWMTPDMKMNLLQYGKILFLDAQKRQFNKSNWPYIGPALKDGEMRVCLAAECLCIQECLDMYVRILQMMHDMEPQYQLSHTSIMFADELITPAVLMKLGIHNTCTLRGDQYHMLNEVWPEAFGSYCPQMRCHLEAMFTSLTRLEYETGYNGATAVIHHDPAMRSKLDVYYFQPERYGGYYLRGMEENLGLNGDAPAEQNHSSVIAHLGEGASWQIAEQVSKLLRRQQELGKQLNERQALENARSHRYKSRFKQQAGVDDVLGKKCLSLKVYNRFITATLKPSTKLQVKTDQAGNTTVWLAGRLESQDDEKIVIEASCRCPCRFRVKWNVMCKHEYRVDGKLNIEKFARRWLNRTTFESNLLPSPDSRTEANNGSEADDGWHDMGFGHPLTQGVEETRACDTIDCDKENHSSDFPNNGEYDSDGSSDSDCEEEESGPLTYQSVKANCDEMCRYVQNDKLQLAQLKLLTDRVISRLRKRLNIHATFIEVEGEGDGANSFMPRDAVGKAINNATSSKRKVSRHEHTRTNKKQRAQKSIAASTNTHFDASDEAHLPAPKLDQRACSFCKKAKHFVGKCPTLHQHGVAPLPRGDLKSRTQLQADLTSGGRIITLNREPSDDRTVYNSLPSGVGAIFIFQRYYVNNLNQNEHEYVDNYCVECTVLKVGGEQHGEYNRCLFFVSCVATRIVKSQSNWIISMVQYNTIVPRIGLDQQQPTSFPPSQIHHHHHSQLSQLSQLSQNSTSNEQRQAVPTGFWNPMNLHQVPVTAPTHPLSNLMLLPNSLVGYSQQPPMGFDFTGVNL